MSSPTISRDLMEYLQKVFPNKLPLEPVDAVKLGVLCGQQKVINHLLAEYQRQTQTVLPATF